MPLAWPLMAGLALASLALLALPAPAEIQAHQEYEPPSPSALAGARNLFLHARVTASGHWSDRAPEFAVDGRHDNPGDHWAAENIPVWLTVELPEAADLSLIRLWTYWDEHRTYQYFIEGSPDGHAWTLLADNRQNTTPQTAAGETFRFSTVKVRFVRTTFTHNSASNVAGGHIVEIEGYALSPAQAAEIAARQEGWAKAPPGLQGAVGSLDLRYPRDLVPATQGARAWSGAAWRGERVAAQLVLWTRSGARQVRLSATPLRTAGGVGLSAGGEEPPGACVHPAFVRYVLADGHLVPDVIDTAERLDLPPQSTRPVWVSVDVPPEARPGHYLGQVEVRAEGQPPLAFALNLEVQPPVLPPPKDWLFHLDLWQNPYALARYHHVAAWSPEHLALLEPHLRLLASAGQKCITTTLVYQPWGTQTYDPYDEMIRWVRRPDGSWRWDYSVFDRWVEVAMKCGITGAINCYSMVSWTSTIRYLDEASGKYRFVSFSPTSPDYAKTWGPFLKDFCAHLREKGWLGRTYIANDERPPELMKPFMQLLHTVAPQLKIALAGGNSPELKDDIDDWCVFISPPLDPALARERTARGKPTTFYVCCGPGRPNTFVFSPPAESAWMGLYAAAQGYTGFLRWAHDSWVQDPLYDTSYVTWPAGDCFLVYPGPRSSIRFERLREGIQGFEKVRLLREALAKRGDAAAREGLRRLDQALARFTYERAQTEPAAEAVAGAERVLAELSRL